MHWAFLVTALAAALQVGPGDSARILAVFPVPSPSHMHVLNALTKALAARGHQLVVASPFPQKKPIANYTDIDMMPSLAEIQKRIFGANLYEMNNMRFHEHCLFFWSMGLGITEAFMTSTQFKNILKDKQGFDLIISEIFMNEALYGLAHHFKVSTKFITYIFLVCR
jgi:glucuronosyltransferase